MEGNGVRIELPDLGEVGEVVVVEWLKGIGDDVSSGEDLVEVETEKTSFVVTAPASGRLRCIEVRAGDRLRVGECLGELEAR
jgi:pyruvate/2-oxoglutarate dehydrogenase complex dihydrolipoamide acyltransferase (E2) component